MSLSRHERSCCERTWYALYAAANWGIAGAGISALLLRFLYAVLPGGMITESIQNIVIGTTTGGTLLVGACKGLRELEIEDHRVIAQRKAEADALREQQRTSNLIDGMRTELSALSTVVRESKHDHKLTSEQLNKIAGRLKSIKKSPPGSSGVLVAASAPMKLRVDPKALPGYPVALAGGSTSKKPRKVYGASGGPQITFNFSGGPRAAGSGSVTVDMKHTQINSSHNRGVPK